jgi:hypothetical protein
MGLKAAGWQTGLARQGLYQEAKSNKNSGPNPEFLFTLILPNFQKKEEKV